MKIMVKWNWVFFKRREKLMNVKVNKSRTYIVPILNRYINVNRGLLVNSYLYDINNPNYNEDSFNGLFLLFKWSNNEVHKQYENQLINSEYTKLHYDFDEEHYMIYCKFPEAVYDDCNYLIDGKFSKISKLNKTTILSYWQSSNTSKVYYILYRKEVYKKELENNLNVNLPWDAELGSSFNDSKGEIFDLNKKDIKLLK